MNKFGFCFAALLTVPMLTSIHAQEPTVVSPLEKQGCDFVGLLQQGKFDALPPLMDAAMQNAMPPAKFKQTWDQLLIQSGAFKEIQSTRHESIGKYDIVIVTCSFEKALLDLRVVYDKERRVSGFSVAPTAKPRDPPYADRAKFREEATEIKTGEYRLPGTYTVPIGVSTPPVAVFVHGSGPNDRDETLGPNKVFRDLAWGLAAQGIASLRYEKRTKAYGDKLEAKDVTPREEVIDDALTALRMCAEAGRFDSARVVVIGHSLGGCLAPQIAKESPVARGIVIMAGSNRHLMELVPEQMNYIFMQDGKIDADEEKQLADTMKSLEQIRASVYMQKLSAYDPLKTAQELKLPIFLAQGGRDYQVRADKDYENWKRALSGRSDVTFHLYSDLDHLFMSGQGPSYPSDYGKPRNVSEEYIRNVADWIKALPSR